MVSVSRQALENLRSALSRFQLDLSGAGFGVGQSVSSLLSECDSYIRKTQDEIARLENEVYHLEGALRDTEKDLGACEAQWAGLKETIPQMYQQMQNLRNQIVQLNSALSAARAQQSAAQSQASQDQASQNQAAQQSSAAAASAAAIERDIGRAQQELQQLTVQTARLEEERRALEGQMDRLRAQYAQIEQELEKDRYSLNRARNKLDQQKAAYGQVQSDLEEYRRAAQFFASSSDQTASASMRAIEQCIESIDAYESVML